ncbi:MAG: 50S ribosomal protein L10 [Bacteroidales bacterium]|nr:50S ribosomal protein L10 [Bacteroidales bacterium]
MRNKEDKNKIIESLSQDLANTNTFYLTDISNLNVSNTNKLRRLCFKRDIRLLVVKNTLLKKAMEKSERDYSPLYDALKGATSIMFSAQSSAPGKLIKEFRKKFDKPVLKGAFTEESFYIGDSQLDILASLKTKNEVIADIIALLQSPAKNVIGALQSGKTKLSGIVQTLSNKES